MPAPFMPSIGLPRPPNQGGGNYPRPPAFPQLPGGGGSGQGQIIGWGQNGPIYGGGSGAPGSIPGASPTLPTPPNLAEIQANPQLQQVFQTMFGKLGTADPYLEKNIANIEGRMSADPTDRAIRRATGQIEDQLAGALQANKERAARMGGAGGGGEASGAQALAGRAQRAEAGAAADISLGRERDLDALALGAGSAYAAPGQRELSWAGQAGNAAQASASNQLGAAGQALAAWQAQQAAALEQQRMAQQQQMAMLNMYANLWG